MRRSHFPPDAPLLLWFNYKILRREGQPQIIVYDVKALQMKTEIGKGNARGLRDPGPSGPLSAESLPQAAFPGAPSPRALRDSRPAAHADPRLAYVVNQTRRNPTAPEMTALAVNAASAA